MNEKQSHVGYIQCIFAQEHPGRGNWDDMLQSVRWAHATQIGLRDQGVVAKVLAGSFSWPVGNGASGGAGSQDVYNLQFSRSDWEAQGPDSQGEYPALYAWVYLPQSEEIVDLSTRHLKAQSSRFFPNLNCSELEAPEYLWSTIDDLPLGVDYYADIDATILVNHVLVPVLQNEANYFPTPTV